MNESKHLKKYIYLILLGFIFTGCTSLKEKMVILPAMQFADLQKTKNSIVMGGVTFEAVPGNFKDVIVVFVEDATEKVYPVKISVPPVERFAEDKNKRQLSYYYFVQLPEGAYHLQQVIGVHEKFEALENYLLNANLTIAKNSIRYIGTVHLKAIGPVMTMMGPILESEIIDDRQPVIKAFLKQYPQFQDQTIETVVIDRYEFFKKDGIGGEF